MTPPLSNNEQCMIGRDPISAVAENAAHQSGSVQNEDTALSSYSTIANSFSEKDLFYAVCQRLTTYQKTKYWPPEDRLTLFYSTTPATMSIALYAYRLMRFLDIEMSSLVLSLLYIYFYCQPTNEVPNELNIHRLCAAALLQACKFNQDILYNNATFAKIAGVSTAEMNRLEIEFNCRFYFRHYVSPREFATFCQALADDYAVFKDDDKYVTLRKSLTGMDYLFDTWDDKTRWWGNEAFNPNEPLHGSGDCHAHTERGLAMTGESSSTVRGTAMTSESSSTVRGTAMTSESSSTLRVPAVTSEPSSTSHSAAEKDKNAKNTNQRRHHQASNKISALPIFFKSQTTTATIITPHQDTPRVTPCVMTSRKIPA